MDKGFIRFSIINRFGREVSFELFRRIAGNLEAGLRGARPDVVSEVLATTNKEDYFTHGSLTIPTPEHERALNRRESFQLNILDEELWGRTFGLGLYIKPELQEQESYLACLSWGRREPSTLFFYGHGLDEHSLGVLERFKEVPEHQELGNGYPKPSQYAINTALAGLKMSGAGRSGVWRLL